MNRKIKIILLIIVFICVILASIAGILFLGEGNYRTVSLFGYSLAIPEDWTDEQQEGSLIFKDGEEETGRFTLLYTDISPLEVPAALGYVDITPEVRESDQFAVKVYELTFSEGDSEICLYVLNDLPNSPPYHAVLELKDLSSRTAKHMLKSFGLPNLGSKLPEKPLETPSEDFLAQAVYTVQRGSSVYAYHTSKLDRLIQAGAEQPADGASVLHILSYIADDEGRAINTWYYLSVGAGEKRIYTYEQGPDGTYFYQNNPRLIRNITREVSKEENYTRYLADGEVILETPYNPYAENREALLAYKDTLIGDNSAVSGLIQKMLPAGVTMEGLSLQTEREPYGLTIRYALEQPELYVTDGVLKEETFYQNALILFSLIENVDTVSMEIRQGETLFNVTYERKAAEEQFENQDLRGFAIDEKIFENFTEDVPKMSPPSEKNSGNGVDGIRVLYSTTVTVSSNAKMPHPKTGAIVRVKPYAERFGVAQYLDRPVTVTLYEKTDAGKITMWASGVCDGVEIATYPISSRAEFDNLLAMLP